MISEKELNQFKKYWKELYRENLSNEQAVEIANNFYNIFRIVYMPILLNQKEGKKINN